MNAQDYAYASMKTISMMRENDALKHQLATYEKNIAVSKQQIAEKDNELTQCKNRLTTLNNQCKEHLTNLINERDQARNDVKSRDATISALNIKIADLTKELSVLKDKVTPAPAMALVQQPKRKRVIAETDSEDEVFVQPLTKKAAPTSYKVTFSEIVDKLGGVKSHSHRSKLVAAYQAEHDKLYKGDASIEKHQIKSQHYPHFHAVMKRV